MSNKIYNSIKWYMDRLVENPCEQTKKDFNCEWRELSDLIYDMWKHDLISDKVMKDCYDVLTDIAIKTVKYF